MRRAPRTWGLALLVAVAMLAATAATATAAPPRPSFVALDVEHLPLPVRAQSAVFTPDGDHLLFPGTPDQGREELYLVRDRGGGLRCLTCGLAGVPHGPAGTGARLVTPFPDGRRVLYTAQTSSSDNSRDSVTVLECSPSVLDCRDRRLLGVDLPPEPGAPGAAGLRMTWHLSPDGHWIVWHDIRLDGSVMVIARLRRAGDHYEATDPKVLNPPSIEDGRGTRSQWAGSGGLYEVKSFVHGGRDVVYVRFGAGGEADQWLLDLRTGERRRLTRYPDWDEDGGLAPDGGRLLTYSFRTMEQVEPFAAIRRPPYLGMNASLLVGNYYLATPSGIRCMIKPWLLPPTGDRDGTLGQPVYPFRGGTLAIANILGDHAWSPGSDAIALSEMNARLRNPKRLAIARLGVPASRPDPIRSSKPGSWAVPPSQWEGAIGSNATVTLPGPAGGQVTLSYTGNAAVGSASATWEGWTRDGKTFLNGTETIAHRLPALFPGEMTFDLTLSGARSRSIRGEVELGRLGAGPDVPGGLPSGESRAVRNGIVTARAGGRVLRGPGDAERCTSRLPRPGRLRITGLRRHHRTLRARVVANVEGRRGPVRGARLSAAGRSAVTGRNGFARIRLGPGAGPRRVRADAGNTFVAAERRLPRR